MVGFAEGLLITTAIINIISCMLLLLGIVISRRKTPTHIYLIYTTVMWFLKQLVNPIFHTLLDIDFLEEYDVKSVVTLIYVCLIMGMLDVMGFFLFMDYFKWISTKKYIIIPVHFIVTIGTVLLYYFILGLTITHSFVMVFIYFIMLLVFLLLVLSKNSLECLVKRKETDSESFLREALILTYLNVRIVTLIIFAFEWIIGMLTWSLFPGYIAASFYHLDTVFYLISLVRNDVIFKSKFLDFFSMCTFNIRRKILSEDLPNDNGMLVTDRDTNVV